MIAFNATPLNYYSSLHHKSFLKIPYLTMAFNFNLQVPIQSPRAQLLFHLRDAALPRPDNVDFSIRNIMRWRMDISGFKNFDDYVATLKSNHKRNYVRTYKVFKEYGASITLVEGNWCEYAETVYQLYRNIAVRRKSQLYDLNFFRNIAAIDAYKLICVWHQNKMVAVLVIFDEEPVYHSMLCGFDYNHSGKIFAYSLIHFELIRLAITTGKHHTIDIGITANKAKSVMNFKPVNVCMDISSRNILIKYCLKLIDAIVHRLG